MKKTLTALLIGSVLLVAGCDNKEVNAKLQQTEQLNNQLKTELTQTQAELTETKTALEQAKSSLPVVFAKTVDLFKKSEEFKRDTSVEKDQYAYDESYIELEFSIVETNVQWLNDLLVPGLPTDEFNLENEEKVDKARIKEILAIADPKERLRAYLAYDYELNRASVSAFQSRAYEYSQTMHYIGQRQNVITFEQRFSSYTGGAHGFGGTDYINIDANKRTIIDLSMAFGENNLGKLKDALWESYKDYNRAKFENYDVTEDSFFVSKDGFTPSSNFYFNKQGVNFVYAPYEIGPYAEGEITLLLPWDLAKDLLKSEYIWQ